MRCEEIQRHNVPFGRKSETGNHPLAARLKKRMIVFNSEGDMIPASGPAIPAAGTLRRKDGTACRAVSREVLSRQF
jgi:hypothetical protein